MGVCRVDQSASQSVAVKLFCWAQGCTITKVNTSLQVLSPRQGNTINKTKRNKTEKHGFPSLPTKTYTSTVSFYSNMAASGSASLYFPCIPYYVSLLDPPVLFERNQGGESTAFDDTITRDVWGGWKNRMRACMGTRTHHAPRITYIILLAKHCDLGCWKLEKGLRWYGGIHQSIKRYEQRSWSPNFHQPSSLTVFV